MLVSPSSRMRATIKGVSTRISRLRHPDEPGRIRCQLRRLWMRLLAIEHLGDCFSYVGCQSRYQGQCLDSLVGARCYHCASICMRYQGRYFLQNEWPADPVTRSRFDRLPRSHQG